MKRKILIVAALAAAAGAFAWTRPHTTPPADLRDAVADNAGFDADDQDLSKAGASVPEAKAAPAAGPGASGTACSQEVKTRYIKFLDRLFDDRMNRKISYEEHRLVDSAIWYAQRSGCSATEYELDLAIAAMEHRHGGYAPLMPSGAGSKAATPISAPEMKARVGEVKTKAGACPPELAVNLAKFMDRLSFAYTNRLINSAEFHLLDSTLWYSQKSGCAAAAEQLRLGKEVLSEWTR